MVRTTTVVALDSINIDPGIQGRCGLDQITVFDYASDMVGGDIFPPVVVFDDGAEKWLADGFHRFSAARFNQTTSILADIRCGTRRDAILFAVGANSRHGLRRSNADKRRSVEILLMDAEWQKWSDREIARRCGVDPKFVGNVRSSLGTVHSENTTRTYTTKHGTVATMDTAEIGNCKPTVQTPSIFEMTEPRLAVHFSSETAEHYTPTHVLAWVRDVFGDRPDLDPCSNDLESPNVDARSHFTVAEDGLRHPWHGRVFLNPPYGREIGLWTSKLRSEWAEERIVEAIALLPARPDTEWFDALTRDTDDLVLAFLYGRLTFVGNDDPAPFPSLVVYLGPHHDRFAQVFAEHGSIWQRPARPLEWFVDHD